MIRLAITDLFAHRSSCLCLLFIHIRKKTPQHTGIVDAKAFLLVLWIKVIDKTLLREYVQIMIEKCNFACVDHPVVGFIYGKYDSGFSEAMAAQHGTKRHYGSWCRMFLKFYLERYKLSAAFQKEFDAFFRQLQERDEDIFGKCDLGLVALTSQKHYRKGLGFALVKPFLDRAQGDGAQRVRLFTNTLASWTFYEKYGFQMIAEKPFQD